MIFVDTSFWVAYRNRRDTHHEAAARLMAIHGDAGLITTNHVRGETWTYLRRRAGHRSAVGFLDILATTPRVSVESVDEATEDQALTWLRQHEEREYSFVDATSFGHMRRRRLSEALAFDGDFGAAGFVELRP